MAPISNFIKSQRIQCFGHISKSNEKPREKERVGSLENGGWMWLRRINKK